MLRYYPSSKIIPNQKTSGGDFILNGKEYIGKYYITYDGRAFSGAYPEVGPNELLTRDSETAYKNTPDNANLAIIDRRTSSKISTHSREKTSGKPNTFYPRPIEEDYTRGYIIRYFAKKENENGFVIEISKEEYNKIVNGTADYDIRLYQVADIIWKLTGPLRSTRTSQYNVTPGIIDVNQRLVETTNKTFFGLTEFIGGDYTKFARPT
jgi:hypothetical protein